MSHAPDQPDHRGTPPTMLWTRWRLPLILITAIGAVGCAAGWALSARPFHFAYLTAFIFALTIVLGVMFFVMLHHAVDAGWSVIVRRPAEQCLAALPVLAILFIPVGIGAATGGPYEWVHATGKIIDAKRPLLNLPVFFLGAVACFAVWQLLAWIMRGRSLAQDRTGDPQLTLSMRRWSGPGFVLYALSVTFAAIDWVMTIDYEWFSTIYAVYVWSGAVVGGLATITLLVLAMRSGPLRGLVPGDHLHDLGKLLFAFSVFWAYIAFSQYFLIWYSNIPEETVWFLHRWTGSWRAVSIVLPLGHFAVPFLVMLPAATKRSPRMLVAMSVLLLAMHYLDVYWLIMPRLYPHSVPARQMWIDFAAAMFVAGACAIAVLRAMSLAAPYPINDPRLKECMEHSEEHAGLDSTEQAEA